MKKEIDRMLELGVIEPSNSEFAAPVVLVPKKDGSIRFCEDYRKLNNIFESDAYPIPRMDEILESDGSAKFISILDLRRGYWQVKMDPDDSAKTAFITPFGLYQFRYMPFGLKGAPATFQRLVDCILSSLPYTRAYLDDIIVF